MLWLVLRFPNLALESLGHQAQDPSSIIVEHQHRVYGASDGALTAGIQLGMKASATLALTETTVLERQVTSEDQAMERLAAWAYRYTPYIQRYTDDCLILEVSRCLRLFGGIETFCQTLLASLNNHPHQYSIGLAHSRQGAWLLSYETADCEMEKISSESSPQAFMTRIGKLSLDHLQNFPRIRDDLKSIGFNTFSDLSPFPSAELSKRFGEAFAAWITGLNGQQVETLPLHQPEETFTASVGFNYPVNDVKLLEIPAEHLLQEFVEYLVEHQQEAQQIDWYFYSSQGQVHTISIGTERIHNQWQLLLDLTRIRLEQLQLYFEVERLELRCAQTSPVQSKNIALFEQLDAFGDETVKEDAEAMVARFKARMGDEAVYQPALRSEQLPEQQQSAVLPFSAQSEQNHINSSPSQGPRPCWLFQKPKRIQCQGNRLFWKGSLQLVQGPERIEGRWWEHRSVRDYFIAQRDDHIRYWVYHDWTDNSWHAQGVFG